MLRQSKYRLMGRAGWGIAIDISAEWTAIDAPPIHSTQIADGVWFICEDDRLDTSELRNLMLGVKMVSQAIAKKKPAGKSILIEILDIEFNPTDYQPEGLVAAMANWGAETFGLPKPEILGIYDKERRKYIFSFEPQSESQPDEAESAAQPIQEVTERLRDARRMLDRGDLTPATEQAGMVVRIVLLGVVLRRTRNQQPEETPATIEHLLTVIGRSQSGTIPPAVMRHGARVGTWYSDLRYGAPSLTKREAEVYLRSAEAVVAWAKEFAR